MLCTNVFLSVALPSRTGKKFPYAVVEPGPAIQNSSTRKKIDASAAITEDALKSLSGLVRPNWTAISAVLAERRLQRQRFIFRYTARSKSAVEAVKKAGRQTDASTAPSAQTQFRVTRLFALVSGTLPAYIVNRVFSQMPPAGNGTGRPFLQRKSLISMYHRSKAWRQTPLWSRVGQGDRPAQPDSIHSWGC